MLQKCYKNTILHVEYQPIIAVCVTKCDATTQCGNPSTTDYNTHNYTTLQTFLHVSMIGLWLGTVWVMLSVKGTWDVTWVYANKDHRNTAYYMWTGWQQYCWHEWRLVAMHSYRMIIMESIKYKHSVTTLLIAWVCLCCAVLIERAEVGWEQYREHVHFLSSSKCLWAQIMWLLHCDYCNVRSFGFLCYMHLFASFIVQKINLCVTFFMQRNCSENRSFTTYLQGI